MKERLSRREFLKGVAGATAGLALVKTGLSPPPASAETYTSATPKISLHGRVVYANAVKARKSLNSFDGAALKQILGHALCTLTGRKTPVDALGLFFSKKDIVGLKLNCLAGKPLSSHPELVRAISALLVDTGIRENNIIVWERSDHELQSAGFKINRSEGGVRCFGTNANYVPPIVFSGSSGSLLSEVVYKCTALINVPVLKDHDISGVSGGMKNLFGCVHNPNKYHDNCCDPYVAEVSAMEPIRKRMRLVILDTLNAQYQGGPAVQSQYLWQENGILVAADPVALDVWGAEILEKKRKAKGLPSFAEAKRPPKWLATAGRMGLGENDPAKIQKIVV